MNIRAILLMIFAMAGFAIEDVCIKILYNMGVPPGMILTVLAALGGCVFLGIAKAQGAMFFSPIFWTPPVLWRNLGEAIGTLGFMTAIALSDISTASAILQATPLAVTMGAALFLGEPVGWRRWSAIIAGFVGVVIIIRPGMAGFDPLSLLAVLGVIGLSMRDVATRALPKDASSTMLSTYSFWILVPLGIAQLYIMDTPPVMPREAYLPMLFAVGIGVIAYYALISAMRLGQTAAVTPFRYTRLIFALGFGVFFFGERPDTWTYVGAFIIIFSGLYTFWREQQRTRRAASVLS